MSNFHIEISFNNDSSTASWHLDGEQPNPIFITAADTISFSFNGPGTLASAILLTGPRDVSTSAASPFMGGSQLNITPDYPLAPAGVLGLWGIAVSFTTTTEGVTSFWFLPDPEMEVGSNAIAPPSTGS